MEASQIQREALANATGNRSMANYGAIFAGFQAKGIPADQIEPRVNVFTFNAWKALGRSVKKGEHGVKVCTWVPMSKKDESGEAQSIGRKPRMTTVFHVSQTKAIDEQAEQREPFTHRPEVKPEPVQPLTQDVQSDGYFSTEFTRSA